MNANILPADTTREGTVYVLHFERPLAHAQHYIGFTQDLPSRLKAHAKGRSGAGIVRAFYEHSIPFAVAATWNAHQSFERHLKQKYKNARRLCPLCQQAKE